jgi:hypothetical protein
VGDRWHLSQEREAASAPSAIARPCAIAENYLYSADMSACFKLAPSSLRAALLARLLLRVRAR